MAYHSSARRNHEINPLCYPLHFSCNGEELVCEMETSKGQPEHLFLIAGATGDDSTARWKRHRTGDKGDAQEGVATLDDSTARWKQNGKIYLAQKLHGCNGSRLEREMKTKGLACFC